MTRWLDRASRKFWRCTGRPVDLAGAEAWLSAPRSSTATVGDAWVAAEAVHLGGTVDSDCRDAGLLPTMTVLDSPGFTAAGLHPLVRDFYEHTAAWHMDTWVGWSPFFWPAGELVSRLFGLRVEQLALPMRPLDLSRGMDSQVSVIRDADGAPVGAAWVRRLRSDGRPVFSGRYATRQLTGAPHVSVHVTFPLELGNVQVLLRPSVTPQGGLILDSPPGRFGKDGAYVTVRDGERDYAARVPLHETFHVFVDDEGTLRTDHELRVWRWWAVRLHYRMRRP